MDPFRKELKKIISSFSVNFSRVCSDSHSDSSNVLISLSFLETEQTAQLTEKLKELVKGQIRPKPLN